MIPIVLGTLVLLFSLYQFFIANNALAVGVGLWRVVLAMVGMFSIRFDHEAVLTAAVFLYALISLLLLATSRSEVQISHD